MRRSARRAIIQVVRVDKIRGVDNTPDLTPSTRPFNYVKVITMKYFENQD